MINPYNSSYTLGFDDCRKRSYQIALDFCSYSRRDIRRLVGCVTNVATQNTDKKTNKVASSLREIALFLVVLLASISIKNSCAAEILDFSTDTHDYTSYREFALTACAPCHYPGIPNGTDLSKQITAMTDHELKSYLAAMLKSGNMPPDSIYREVLYLKFLEIEKPQFSMGK